MVDGRSFEVSAAEAVELTRTGWLLDVREQDEWDRGHAPTAHLIPMSVIEQRSGELPEDEQILVICHSGYRSARVTQALLAAGYDAVNIAGGMDAWQSAGGVVVTDGPDSPHA